MRFGPGCTSERLEVERVSPALDIKPLARHAAQRRQQPVRRFAGQWADVEDFGRAVPNRGLERGFEVGRPARPRGERQQDAGRRRAVEEQGQYLGGGRVSPLHVVQQYGHRLLAGQKLEQCPGRARHAVASVG